MTLRKINATFISITKAFTRCKGKVLQKFLIDMIFGIISSKSLNLSEISRSLEKNSNTCSRHIHKRIDRHLGGHDLTQLKEEVQGKQCRLIDENTYIYFDPTDVIKPHGKRFELMSLVPDGSDEHKRKKGYPVTACVAIKDEELIPVDLDLGSHLETTFDSKNQRYLYHMDGINELSRGKGIFVLDREFDGFPVIRHLHERDINFVIRMTEQRHYYLEGDWRKTYKRHEIIDRYAQIITTAIFDIRNKKDKKIEKLEFTVKAVKVRLTTSIDSDRSLTLIRAKSRKLTMYLLTNLQDLSEESIAEIFQAYLNRWKVEEYIRFVKQQYGMEKFKVLSIARIRNLIQLLFISTVILARISELGIRFSKTRAVLINKAKRTYKVPQKLRFFLYLIADGLAYILRNFTKQIEVMADKVPKTQLPLPFGKRGTQKMG